MKQSFGIIMVRMKQRVSSIYIAAGIFLLADLQNVTDLQAIKNRLMSMKSWHLNGNTIVDIIDAHMNMGKYIDVNG